MTPDADDVETWGPAEARRVFRKTLSLWASDYLLCRSLWHGSAVSAPMPWQAQPLLRPEQRDAA